VCECVCGGGVACTHTVSARRVALPTAMSNVYRSDASRHSVVFSDATEMVSPVTSPTAGDLGDGGALGIAGKHIARYR
jgi:hypothetical protein